MLLTSYGRQTESSYCCIQPAPSREDGTASLCFVLITTCNILYFVFELTISHACLCSLAVAAQAMLQQRPRHNVCMHPDTNISYVHYIACANKLQSSIDMTYVSVNFHIYIDRTFRPYEVISGLMTSHPRQIAYQSTLRTWLRTVWGLHVSTIKCAHSCSPNHVCRNIGMH